VVTNPDSSTVTLGPYQVQVNGAGGVVDNNTPLAPNTGVGRINTIDPVIIIIFIAFSTTVVLHVVFKNIKIPSLSKDLAHNRSHRTNKR